MMCIDTLRRNELPGAFRICALFSMAVVLLFGRVPALQAQSEIVESKRQPNKPVETLDMKALEDFLERARASQPNSVPRKTDSDQGQNASSAARDNSKENMPADSSTTSSQDSARLRLNFRFAPWSEVLQWLAERNQLTLDPSVVPEGTFNYFDQKPRTENEVMDVINRYLIQRGYLVTVRDRFLVTVRLADGIPNSLITETTVDRIENLSGTTIVRLVLPVGNADPIGSAESIQPMLSSFGKAIGLSGSNAVVLIDQASVVRSVVQIFSSAGDGLDGRAVRTFDLQHITADDLEQVVSDLLANSDRSAGLPANQTRSTPSSSRLRMKSVLDGRTLIAIGAPGELGLIEQVARVMDTERNQNRRSQTAPVTRVYQVRSTDVEPMQGMLASILPRVRVSSTRAASSKPSPNTGSNASGSKSAQPTQKRSSDFERNLRETLESQIKEKALPSNR